MLTDSNVQRSSRSSSMKKAQNIRLMGWDSLHKMAGG